MGWGVGVHLYIDCVDLPPGEASCCRQVSVLNFCQGRLSYTVDT